MSVGDGGYTGKANASGPAAGYDPVIGTIDRRNKKQKNYPKSSVHDIPVDVECLGILNKV